MSSENDISLFILKKSSASLKQAEVFLRNRKWNLSGAFKMKDALGLISQRKPEFVMICADHPNRKARLLPKLLTQAFPVKIIAYSETSTPAAMLTLREMGQKYTLFPPISGPSIERMILKIRKDIETEALLAQSQANGVAVNGDSDESGTIRLKGDNNFDSGGGGPGSAIEQARYALNSFINTGDDDNGDSILGQTDHGGLNSAAYMPNSDPREGEHQAQWEQHSPEGNATAGYIPSQNDSQNNPGGFNGHSGTNGGDSANWGQQSGGDISGASHTGGGVGLDGGGLDNSRSGHSDDGTTNNDNQTSSWSGTQKKVPIMESDYIKKKNKQPVYIQGQKREDVDNESLFVKGSIDALESTVIQGDDLPEEKITKIENSANIACITIDSPRFSGYLVAALGKNRKIDKQFTDSIKQKLFSFLIANGETVNDEESMDLNLKEVEFEGWALQQAEFLKKSLHDGNEIAIAFFPNKNLADKLEETNKENMLKMSIDELKDDVAVEFDLYIHLAANDKMILYTAQGQPIYGEQRGRLKGNGITHMHLKKESSHDFKKYKAQIFLNEKIEFYKETNRLKKGS